MVLQQDCGTTRSGQRANHLVRDLLATDQCGVTAQTQTSAVGILNEGQGRLTVSATLQSTTTAAATPGLGGAGGPGRKCLGVDNSNEVRMGAQGPSGPAGPRGTDGTFTIAPIGEATPLPSSPRSAAMHH